MSILCALASQRQGKLTSPHTREMQASATMPSHLAGNYRAFIDLEGFDTQPSSSHGEAYKQWELTGLWTLWENTTPTPPGCHVWHSQRQWGLTESSLPNSLWRKSAHSPSASLGDEHSSITGPSPDEGPGLTPIIPHSALTYRSAHVLLPWLSVLSMYLFSSTPLLSFPLHSLLSFDSSKTLAKLL